MTRPANAPVHPYPFARFFVEDVFPSDPFTRPGHEEGTLSFSGLSGK